MDFEIGGVSVFVAFVAGLLSCLSPCVLPLVPAYLGYLTGASLDPAPAGGRSDGVQQVAVAAGSGGTSTVAIGGVSGRPSPFLHALSFVSGFALVFVAFGVSLGILGYFLRDHQEIILKVSGTLLIAMGFHLADIITIPFLHRERRIDVPAGARIGYARSFAVGSTFSAGWSPCIGPTLGAILGLAVSSGQVAEAGALLLVYSAGLSVPFLAMGLAYNGVRPLYERVKGCSGVINAVSGTMLILVGILVFTDSLVDLNGWFDFGFLGDISGKA